MRLRPRSLFLVLSLFLATSLFAQTTASLSGVVTSEGSPLPGVTVTVSSPALQGTRTSVTEDGGGYSFPALPPGSYTVKFELSGMAPVQKRTTLALSQPGKLDADLKVSTVSEAITVTATAPTVLESPQVAATLTSEQIEELPVPRTFESAALLAPGVNSNTLSASQFQISGSPGYDNLVMVNGVSVTESVRSQFLNLFIEDAIQETTVLTGAISAEYGRFTGGVVNTITKQGGNEFTGSFRDSLTNADWTAKTPFRDAAGNPQADPIDKVNSVYEATLGGYVLRDRLWFFTAGRSAETSGQAQTQAVSSTTNPLRNLNPTYYSIGDEETRYEVKLTGAVTPKHSLVGSYINVDRHETNNRFTAAIYDTASLNDRDRPDTLAAAHYNGVLTNNLLIEGAWSHRTMEFQNSGSKFTDLQKGTLLLDRSNSDARFASPTFCGVCDTESRNNDSLLLKANYFFSTRSLGNHNMVAGAEDFTEHRYANNHQSGSDYRIFVSNVWFDPQGNIYPNFENVAARPTFIRWTPIFNGANESNLNVRSVFLNDRWDLSPRWSFNVGVRYDKNDAVDGTGNKSSDDQAISPRLTVMFDPFANGRHRFSAAYNNYVSRVVEGVAASNSSAGEPAAIDFAYTGPAINPQSNPFAVPLYTAIQQVFDWFLAQCNASNQCGPNNTALLFPGGARTVPGYSNIVADTLKSPSVDEFSLGYAVQIGTNAYAKVDYIHRDWKDFYATELTQTTPKTTNPLNINVDQGVVQNSDLIERTYRAVQLQAGWRPRRFNLGMNYTWAKLRGNDEGETAGSGPVTNTPLALFYPEYQGYDNRLPVGPLAGDQRHRLRAWLGYDLPIPQAFGTVNLSLLQRYDSGVAWSESFAINSRTYPGAPAVANTNYRSVPATATYYLCRGCNRTDDETGTDLAINYSKQIWVAQGFVQAEVINVFDEDAISNSGFIRQTITRTSTAFNPFTETPVEGTHYTKAADFGKPTSFQAYQTARTYRISFGVRF